MSSPEDAAGAWLQQQYQRRLTAITKAIVQQVMADNLKLLTRIEESLNLGMERLLEKCRDLQKEFEQESIDAENREEDMNRMLKATEAAKMLGVSTQTLYKWRRKKTGPLCTNVGGQYRYTLENLKDWIAVNTEKG